MTRQEALLLRDGLSPEDRRRWSEAMTAHVLAWADYRKARTVMAFSSFGSEAETGRLLAETLKAGKRLALPRCGPKGRMDARAASSLEALIPGRYGILEPGEDAPYVAPEEIELIIVPGVLFDQKGDRMGYGAGYYDRFLRRYAGMTLGYAFSAQVARRIEAAPHDMPVRAIVTEHGIFCTGRV